jgi:hypothetical protein
MHLAVFEIEQTAVAFAEVAIREQPKILRTHTVGQGAAVNFQNVGSR